MSFSLSRSIPAIGTLLKRGNGASPEVFTTVAECTDISGPAITATLKEVTYQDQGSRFKQYITTTIDPGKLTVKLNFIPTDPTQNGTAGLLNDLVNGTRHNYQLVFPDAGATTWQFAAYCSKFQTDEKTSDELTGSVELQLSGNVVIP